MKKYLGLKQIQKEKIKHFEFLEVIRQFPNSTDSQDFGHLVKIYKAIDKLPHLHSSTLICSAA